MPIPTLTLKLALTMLEDTSLELVLANAALTTNTVTPAQKIKLTKLLQEREMLRNRIKEKFHDLLGTMNGLLYAYDGNKYRDVTAAIAANDYEAITEPYSGGEFKTAQQVIDIINVIWIADHVSNSNIKLFFVKAGVVFADEPNCISLELDELDKHFN